MEIFWYVLRVIGFGNNFVSSIHSPMLTRSLPAILQLFVTRELSKDMNMEIYNKMLEVQHNPKFASYFAPVAGDMNMQQ
jgi:hypothetical protein